jgi:hypothetical protein
MDLALEFLIVWKTGAIWVLKGNTIAKDQVRLGKQVGDDVNKLIIRFRS